MGTTIVVVGDVMLDRYLTCAADRLAGEAPVPVHRVTAEVAAPGGAANAAVNVAALGGRAVLHGLVGHDAAGEALAALLARAGVAARLRRVPAATTTVKTRLVAADGRTLARYDVERLPHPADDRPAWGLLRDDGPALVVVSDYAHGTLAGPDGAPALMTAARAAGVPVLVDTKRSRLDDYAGAALVKVNAAEAGRLLHAAGGLDGPEGLCRRHRLGGLLVTRGGDGMTLHRVGRPPLEVPAFHPRRVCGVVGAGDTVLAALAVQLAAGADVAAAARYAAVAAGVAVGRPGTSLVTAADVLAAADPRPGDKDLADAASAAARAAGWRRGGLRVHVTNGCFDLLHAGHVSLLRRAAAPDARLLVLLNTDASVAALKGAGRPVVPYAQRAACLAALPEVDAVAPFDGDAALCALLADVRPDVLVKGDDYAADLVVGAAVVRGHGGVVRVVPRLPGYSTTAALAAAAANGPACA